MIPPGTKVIIDWEYYDYVDKINIEYIKNIMIHGTIVEYNDNTLDKQMKSEGKLKIKIDKEDKFSSDDVIYCRECDVEIENN